nr:hypothetical protein [uncultured Pseudodesulfovibrio sp.]
MQDSVLLVRFYPSKTVFAPIARWLVVLYTWYMDEKTIEELRTLAEENGIDPEVLLAIAEADGLPEDLQNAIAAVLGDVATFGHALDKLDK